MMEVDWVAVWCSLAAGTTALILTVLDLDKTFYVPQDAKRRLILQCYWWGFTVANGLLAIILYLNVRNIAAFRGWNQLLLAIVTGVTYLALLRMKFTTFSFEGKDVPLGIEALYDACRGYIFKRINRIAREARREEALKLSASKSLRDLAHHAYNTIENDALTSEDDKADARKWLQDIMAENIDVEQKKIVLAIFVLSERRAKTVKMDIHDEPDLMLREAP